MISAFELREDEDSLSVNWLEHPSAGSIDKIRRVFQDKNYTLRPRGRFATLRVSCVRVRAAEDRISICVFHDPKCEDHSHTSVALPSGSDRMRLAAGLLHSCLSGIDPGLV